VEPGFCAFAVATASALDELLSCARHVDGSNDTRSIWVQNRDGVERGVLLCMMLQTLVDSENMKSNGIY
jgi:hypothetical protein